MTTITTAVDTRPRLAPWVPWSILGLSLAAGSGITATAGSFNLLGGTEGNSFFMPEPVTKEDLEAFAELFDFAKLG